MTTDYDYNIYGCEKYAVNLTAYQQYCDPNENSGQNIRMNTARYHTIKFTLEDNPEEFCYLMDAEYPEEAFPDGIEDYDYWDGYDYLTEGETPATIIAWLNSLPEYDMEVGD
jgi:hypothetical protein